MQMDFYVFGQILNWSLKAFPTTKPVRMCETKNRKSPPVMNSGEISNNFFFWSQLKLSKTNPILCKIWRWARICAWKKKICSSFGDTSRNLKYFYKFPTWSPLIVVECLCHFKNFQPLPLPYKSTLNFLLLAKNSPVTGWGALSKQSNIKMSKERPIHQPTHKTIHPPIGGGVYTYFKSSNRIEISWII